MYTSRLPPTGPLLVHSLKGKETMPSYLLQASYTTEALASLIKKPQNRTEIVRKVDDGLAAMKKAATSGYKPVSAS